MINNLVGRPIIYCRPEFYEKIKQKFSKNPSENLHFLRQWEIVVNPFLPIEYDLPYDRFIEYEESDRWWLERLGMLVPKMVCYVMDNAYFSVFNPIRMTKIRIEKGLKEFKEC